ncbi:MAG: PDZ domain-containing protein [Proteobacteria bacterium]|nr:PDZ domain-containing protein [Pseudomonadota bacterium]
MSRKNQPNRMADMKKLHIIISAAALMMLTGCAGNAFTNFYTGKTLEQVQAAGGIQTCQSPEIRSMPPGEPKDVGNRMYTEGFRPIGTSAWEGPGNQGNDEALAQGKNVGACLVLWKADYSHTRQESIPITTYTPGGTSTTIHTGNVYSGSSTGSYSGISTTYNPGTASTQYIPYSVNRYNYLAVYFARLVNDPQKLMIKIESPPDSYMRETDSRSGGLVTAVMKDGNAYKANIFPGDIIMTINGQPTDPDVSTQTLMKPGANELKIYRDGKVITKNINIQ